MKSKESKEKYKKILYPFFKPILLWTLFFALVFIVAYVLIPSLDFQWVFDRSPGFYYDMVRLFSFFRNFPVSFLFCLFLWFFGVFFFLYKLLKKIFDYKESIVSASKDVFNKEVEFIELPKELEDLEKQLNHLKREYEKKERLAKENEQRKNDLVVYLAHDLKTPLTSMIGYLSLLDEVKDMPTIQREKYIKIALEKSYRLEDLINELFDITRFNSETIVLEKEKLNIKLMLEQMIDDFYPVLKEENKKIDLICCENPCVYGDPNKLARVFSNLIKNAIFYSLEDTIQIEVKKTKEEIQCVIANKGKEIPKEKLQKIFEKFYRMDYSRTSKTGGSGLGLAIAKEIVELHGGKIYATSDSEFTKFYVHLPYKEIS